MEYVTSTGFSEMRIEVIEGGKKVIVDGQVHEVDMRDIGNHALFSLLVDNRSYEVLIEEQADGCRVLLRGKVYNIRVQSLERHRLAKLASPPPVLKAKAEIQAPMPGVVVAVPVAAGQSVTAGQVLVILESMKMENEVRAPQDGMVQALHVRPGDMVNGRQVLLVVG
ncbi:MAG: biotin/lipoyl-binding protein [Chloroflexi bacterium]|nr:biotin/lipoyl-binding protein [Chloroflexota bacterium]